MADNLVPLPGAELLPAFKMTPNVVFKTLASTVVATIGYFYLTTARKQGDVGKMLAGAILILASLFLFF